MADITYGFKQVTIDEHDFARFLKRNKALENCQSIGKSNQWFGPDGQVVAICYYHGEGGMDVNYYIRSDLSL